MSELPEFRDSTRIFNWLASFHINSCTILELFFTPFIQKLVKTRSSHRWCSLRKGVLRKFGKFTGKHSYQNLYFNKVAEHVWATASVKQPKTRVYFLSFSIFRWHVIVQTHRNKLNIIFIT